MIRVMRIADCGLRYDWPNPHSAIRVPQSIRIPQSAIRNGYSSRFANTIAPIIATSSSIDAISNGIR